MIEQAHLSQQGCKCWQIMCCCTEAPVLSNYCILGPGQQGLTHFCLAFGHLSRYHGEQAAEDQCGEHRGESPCFSRDTLLFWYFHQPEHWGSDTFPRDSLSERQQWKTVSSYHQRKRHCGGNKSEYLYMCGVYTHSQQQLLFVFFRFWNP